MNTKVKLAIVWGGLITSILVGINFFQHLFTPQQHNVVIVNGMRPGGRGHHGGFGPQHAMNIPHYGGDFSWLGLLVFLVIGLVALVLLVKWMRKKSKSQAMQQFIETPLTSSYTRVINSNATVLDQWEKNLPNKKENE